MNPLRRIGACNTIFWGDNPNMVLPSRRFLGGESSIKHTLPMLGGMLD